MDGHAAVEIAQGGVSGVVYLLLFLLTGSGAVIALLFRTNNQLRDKIELLLEKQSATREKDVEKLTTVVQANTVAMQRAEQTIAFVRRESEVD